MRKMMNKKGFTLVELMIVVVILGILVAIAIPIFSSVTKNAKKKACESNIRIIEGNISTYLATGNDGGPVAATTTADSMKADNVFLAMFKGGALPKCQSNGGTDYNITLSWANGIASYSVTCADTQCPVNETTGA